MRSQARSLGVKLYIILYCNISLKFHNLGQHRLFRST